MSRMLCMNFQQNCGMLTPGLAELKKFINHPANLPLIPLKQIKITFWKTVTHKTTFQSTIHSDLSRKETGYTKSWVCVISPNTKGISNMALWIITAHISLGDLNRQLHIFHHQKTLTHQLLVNLQVQPLASHFVLNALLGEFSNTDIIYYSYKQTIWSAV